MITCASFLDFIYISYIVLLERFTFYVLSLVTIVINLEEFITFEFDTKLK